MRQIKLIQNLVAFLLFNTEGVSQIRVRAEPDVRHRRPLRTDHSSCRDDQIPRPYETA